MNSFRILQKFIRLTEPENILHYRDLLDDDLLRNHLGYNNVIMLELSGLGIWQADRTIRGHLLLRIKMQ